MKTYIVDAFTDVPFSGNPAGVCLPSRLLTETQMLSIAQELNLSETAFIEARSDGIWAIRYFSPVMEIPLCGHATLAAAKVVFGSSDVNQIAFETTGRIHLDVMQQSGGLTMSFPRYAIRPADASPELLRALGVDEVDGCFFNQETGILMLIISSAAALKHLTPDFFALKRSHDSISGVLVTAPSNDDAHDFHSRYFWPWSGTNEDPVTGGTHTFLAPYWSDRLGKTVLNSFQSSARTGSMEVEVLADSIIIKGQAVVVFEGKCAIEF